MKRQIRENVFETNSSSVHAICVSKDKPTEYPEYVKFNHGDWGWEFGVHNTVSERASYLYELVCEMCWDDEKKKSEYLNHLYDVLGKHGINCDFDRNDFEVWEHNGITTEFPIGYVDHGHAAIEFFDAVMHNESRLLRFLFNNESLVITGNDNTDLHSENVWDGVSKLDKSNYEIYLKGN